MTDYSELRAGKIHNFWIADDSPGTAMSAVKSDTKAREQSSGSTSLFYPSLIFDLVTVLT